MSIAMKAGRLAVLVTAVVAAAPATAAAQGAPGVATGGVTERTTTTVTLNGRVNPNGATTRYYFQYGTTRNYGATTVAEQTGTGTQPRQVKATISGLAPATEYHYRLIAENRFDIRRGEDRTFRTRPEPLGLTLGANPNPTKWNGSTTMLGVLSGTGNAGRQVVLQYQPWPYTAAFVNYGFPAVTDANGGFGFFIPNVTINTQTRVVLPNDPDVVSPNVLLQALARVQTDVRTKAYPRSKRVRFRGTVTPAIDGEQMQVQRLIDGTWEIVRTMRAKARRGNSSKYRKSMLVRKSGRYRIVANVSSGAYTSAPGREVRVRVRRGR